MPRRHRHLLRERSGRRHPALRQQAADAPPAPHRGELLVSSERQRWHRLRPRCGTPYLTAFSLSARNWQFFRHILRGHCWHRFCQNGIGEKRVFTIKIIAATQIDCHLKQRLTHHVRAQAQARRLTWNDLNISLLHPGQIFPGAGLHHPKATAIRDSSVDPKQGNAEIEALPENRLLARLSQANGQRH